MVYQLCAGYSPQLIRNELGVPNSKRQTDMIRSLGQTAGYWLEVIFACSVGKCDTVIVDEAAIGKRKDQRGSRVRQGGTEWYMSVVHFDATNRKILAGWFEKIRTWACGQRETGGYRFRVFLHGFSNILRFFKLCGQEHLSWHVRRLASWGAVVHTDGKSRSPTATLN